MIGILVSIAGFAVGLNTTAGELLLLAGLGSIGGAIGDRVYLKWFLKKYVADSQNEKLFSEARAVVDETGIKSEAKTGVVSFYPWGSIIRAEDLGDLRLLYVGKLAAIVMERRAHTPEDWDSLAQWITAKVPSYSST